MKKSFIKLTKTGCVIVFLLLAVEGCQKNPFPKANELKANYEQVNLVGDDDQYSPLRIVPDLKNAWGMAFAPSGPVWVNAEVTGLSFIFNTQGGDVRPPVAIPSPGSDEGGGHPTGIVFNGSSGFTLPNGHPARFIFVGVDGVISAWNGGDVAVKLGDHTAAYTGLAIAADGPDSFIYAANFRTGQIDVYDTSWSEVSGKPFTDPSLPQGYSPFNIQNVGGNLFVTYAKVDVEEGEEEKGPGLGFVDIYSPAGQLIKRFASEGKLNAPWGVAEAPTAFWKDQDLDGDEEDNGKMIGEKHHHPKTVILIGNFGDGHIGAYDQDGEFLGQLRSNGKKIEIEGLWAISFAPASATAIDPNWLFFAAGPGDEEHGLFGYIKRD
jgi:uncharacterized protein (TIGR03118 family)